MRRFLFPPEARAGDVVTLTGDLYRHAVKVLRLKEGTRIVLADGHGEELVGRIERVGRTEVLVAVEGLHGTDGDTGLDIAIYQGLPKGAKIDLVLQKCTELGAASIVPFLAERSLCRLTPEQRKDRARRWERIASEAARQSGRKTVPAVSLAADLSEVVENAGQEVKLLLWEEERATRLKDFLTARPPPASVAVLVGPEGGFSAAEVARAVAGGFTPVTLGKRILRTESAALAIIAILQYQWGDIG